MAMRPTGQYVSKNKSNKKSKSRAKENRFSKKQFFNLCTPNIFAETTHGRTSHPRTKSKQDLSSFLIGRSFTVNQGDLNGQNTETHRNFSFKIAKVRGTDCFGEFNGMSISRDKINNIIKKWHSLVDAHMDLTTSDGSIWRFFISAVTKRMPGQVKKNSYCQTSAAKQMRKVMFDVLTEQVEGKDINRVIEKLMTEAIGTEVEKGCQSIYPVTAVVTKVKAIKNMKLIDSSKTSVMPEVDNNEFVITETA